MFLKIRAALFTAGVFGVLAAVIVSMQWAKEHAGTIEAKYALLGLCMAWIAWAIYRMRLDTLEERESVINRIMLRNLAAQKQQKSE